jgi:hypothetical protein
MSEKVVTSVVGFLNKMPDWLKAMVMCAAFMIGYHWVTRPADAGESIVNTRVTVLEQKVNALEITLSRIEGKVDILISR